MTKIKTWSQSMETDSIMAHEHLEIWKSMIESVSENPERMNVLDFGCNQGGFLRTLYYLKGFRRGLGIDIAEDAIKHAQKNKADLPIEYMVMDDLKGLENQFDIAFSHDVVYLLPDIDKHAHDMSEVLKKGGSYYLCLSYHTENALHRHWRSVIKDVSNVPAYDYSIEDISNAFSKAGFSISAKWLRIDNFISYNENSQGYFPDLKSLLNLYQGNQILFKLVKR